MNTVDGPILTPFKDGPIFPGMQMMVGSRWITKPGR